LDDLSKQTSHSFDVVIVGGGMIGASCALGFAKQGLKIAVIERAKPEPFESSQAPEIRMSALNMHSVSLMKKLNAWQHIESKRFRPYSRLSVWENSDYKTQFSAQEINQAQLGFFVENRLTQLSFYEEVSENFAERVHFYFDDAVDKIDTNTGLIELNSNIRLQSKLIVGADGANSLVRKSCNIPVTSWQYSQKANAIMIQTLEPVEDETWQQFFPSGPRALLPMFDNFACLVWYDDEQTSNWIGNASLQDLKPALINAFGASLGSFEIVQVVSFPISRMHARRYGREKAIILGDAAHTINPLAGQGVNIGFDDVDALLELVDELGLDDISVLTKRFEGKRKAHNLVMSGAMDTIYMSFSNSFTPLQKIRNLGLRIADNAGFIKRKALEYAVGIR
jgi:2-octaprenyl-3-methyl-6-methoxy-1,4-benzoquinol hydroxylase